MMPSNGPDLTDATVLIPAAGRVPEGILSFSSIATPAMIPVAGAPVIHWNLRYLTGLGASRFRIAVPVRGLSLEDYAECVFGDTVTFEWIVPANDRGVGSTVIELLDGVDGSALVVFGDTLFEFGETVMPADRHWLLTGAVDGSERWCVVDVADGAITGWHDKEEALPGPLDAAAGVYWIPDASRAHDDGSQLLDASDRVEMSELMRAAAGDELVLATEAGTWRDCGNPDTQEVSRRQVLQERAFNSLSFDDRLGTIRKSSENRAKLIDEINYVRLLPAEVAALFPRIVRSSTEWDDPWVELEYYGYPTLTELYLFERLQPSVWSGIFRRLSDVLGILAEHPRPVAPSALQDMYIGKTRRRLEQCRSIPHMAELVGAERLVINGVERTNLPGLLDAAEDAVATQAGGAIGAIVHGDLCFSNVLFDVRTGVCKLIDPRGSFGDVGIYGDQRYDLAKIHHSVIAGYDHLVAGLFRLTVDGADVDLRVHETNAQLAVQRQYEDQFLDVGSSEQIELITGLMFAGLPALHSESPERQRALYVRGVEMVSAALGEGKWR